MRFPAHWVAAFGLATTSVFGAVPGGKVLVFSSAPRAAGLAEPAITIANVDASIEAGDVLEYDVQVAAVRAQVLGVELVFRDGNRLDAPLAPAVGAWSHVRIALDPFVGKQLAHVDLVARGQLWDRCLYRVDEIVVTHTHGEPLVVFRDALPSGTSLVRDDDSACGVAVVEESAEFSAARASLENTALPEPWSAFDLKGLLRTAGRPAPDDDRAPRGFVLTDSAVPMRFADLGQTPSFPAAGQRIALEPIDGGRYYTFWIAVTSSVAEDTVTRAYVFGEGGDRRIVDFVVPGRGATDANRARGDVCTRIELPVATEFAIQSFEFPNDPHILVHAITVQWRKQGAVDSAFRLACLDRASLFNRALPITTRASIARYLRNRRYGALFVDLDSEDEPERALFDAYVRGDTAAFDTTLAERIAEHKKIGAKLQSLRITFERPAPTTALDATLQVDRIGAGGEALLRALGTKAPPRPHFAGDLAYLRQLPQLLASIGVEAVILEGTQDVTRWRAPDGASVLGVQPFAVFDDAKSFDPRTWHAWVKSAATPTGTPEVFVARSIAGAARQDTIPLLGMLMRTDIAPRVRGATAAQFALDSANRLGKSTPDFAMADVRGLSPGLDAAERELALDGRRAESALTTTETFAALARADGLRSARDELDELWSKVVSRTTSDSRAVSDLVVARTRDMLADELEVLARAATTTGDGTPLVAFNPLTTPRRALVEVDAASGSMIDFEGHAVPSQTSARGTRIFEIEVPSLGYTVVHALRENAANPALSTSSLTVEGWTARNEALSFTIDPKTGALVSLIALPDKTELLSAPAEITGADFRLDSAQFVERGPLRVVARVERSSSRVKVVVEFTLSAKSRRLEVRVRCEAKTDDSALRARFPLAHIGPKTFTAVPFGGASMSRPTGSAIAHYRAADWLDVTDGRGALAFLADDAATLAIEENAVSFDLLSAPDVGAPRETSFALMPHVGGWRRAGVAQEALEFTRPIEVILTSAHDGARPPRGVFLSMLRLTSTGALAEGRESGLVLSSLQASNDGDGWILRIVETQGTNGQARLEFDRPVFQAQRIDLRGQPLGDLKSNERRVELPIGANRVETLRVRLRP